MSKKEFQQPPSPPPPNNPRQCNFWVKRKRRYCHLPKKLDNNYCGEHLQCEVKVGIKKERIPCPFDPSHTVYKIELEKHLKHKCNSRPKPTPAYFSLDINCTLPTPISPIDDNDGDKSNDDGKITLSGLSKETLNILINNVRNWYNNNDAVPKIIRTEVLDHEVLKEKKEITKNQKHVIQQRLELLKANSCSIEFGCGKGELSYFKKLAIKKEADDNNNKSTFILIDRKNTRGKFDSLIRGSLDNKSIIKRIEIDIKDLDLSIEILGYQCKRILDAGRVKFLEANGFQAELIYYVEPSTSLENLALIAIPKKL
ncbi:15220_t:CDS:2 [Entrophospora sp. SA101]|nr:15220_t:CDS:2 [Entrophospora sp. SA101]CAJ0842777.1 5871_t:CDS:2 [Entrophospora sp. SA101]CAJ0924762.1 7629_t:CDS:2 [Entrophospora sp. SA101]